MASATQAWLPDGLKEAARETAEKRGIKSLSMFIRLLIEREVYSRGESGGWTEWTELTEGGQEYRIVETSGPYRTFIFGGSVPVAETLGGGVIVAAPGIAKKMAAALNAMRTLSPLRAVALRLVRKLPGDVKQGEIGELCVAIESLGEESATPGVVS